MGQQDTPPKNIEGWGAFTRIVGGVVGARPVLPNTAGGSGKKTPEGLTPEQAAQFKGQQGPTPEQVAGDPKAQQSGAGQSPGAMVNSGNTTHINVTNNSATEAGTGRDIAWLQQGSNMGPGM